MSPCTSASGKVAPTGVPLSVGDRVVVGGAEMLDAAAPRRTLTAGLVDIEVKIPELKLGLARGPDSREHDMPTTRRPAHRVACPSGEGLEQLEVALAALMLVEADIGLDSDTRARVAEVGIAT